MKILFALIIFALMFATESKAQNATNKDTINLIGVLYNTKGQPVSHAIVQSKQATQRGVPLGTYTDADGVFALNGVMINDTLTILDVRYKEVAYYNTGSRFMVIYLPAEDIKNLNGDNPVIVSAKRKVPKPVSPTVLLPNSPNFVLMAPRFSGGTDKFMPYIKSRIKYPENAINNNIEGTVQISFTTQLNGALSNFAILKGLGYGCDDEVVNAIKSSPAWIPGIMNGQPVPVNISVSVQFKLTGM